MTEWVFQAPEDLRGFFAEVLAAIGLVPPEARARAFGAEDAFQSGCGYGGWVPQGGGRFRLVYFPEGRGERWILLLDEAELRALASGAKRLLTPRIEKVERKAQRWPSGEGLLVWGRTNREAMAAGDREELACALEALRAQGAETPQSFRLWSRMDDLARVVVHGDRCALLVAFPDGTCACTDAGTAGGAPEREARGPGRGRRPLQGPQGTVARVGAGGVGAGGVRADGRAGSAPRGRGL
ncbi:MAG: hypothetical protein QM765_48240 [Myxococcales bacterium]